MWIKVWMALSTVYGAISYLVAIGNATAWAYWLAVLGSVGSYLLLGAFGPSVVTIALLFFYKGNIVWMFSMASGFIAAIVYHCVTHHAPLDDEMDYMPWSASSTSAFPTSPDYLKALDTLQGLEETSRVIHSREWVTGSPSAAWDDGHLSLENQPGAGLPDGYAPSGSEEASSWQRQEEERRRRAEQEYYEQRRREEEEQSRRRYEEEVARQRWERQEMEREARRREEEQRRNEEAYHRQVEEWQRNNGW